MKPSHHVVASGIISMAFAYATRSWSGTASCFLSGILIDIDHVLDFWLAKKKIFFTYKELCSFCGHDKEGRIHLIFHSYELLFVLWLIIISSPLNMVWLGIVLGMSVHLLADHWTNPVRPYVYFFYYRLKNGFSKERTFTEEYFKGFA